MSVITRLLPKSHTTRNQVLTDAYNQKGAVSPAANIFSLATSNRIDEIKPLYHSGMGKIKLSQEALGQLTTEKEQAADWLRMLCSQFIQVFNFTIERGENTADDRLYYGLDKETGKLPSMTSEDDLKDVSLNLIEGEANRVAAGGTAMSNPDIALIFAADGQFNKKVTEHQTAGLELIDAQNELNLLVPEADKVIKKIYDEAETHYNELEPSAQREACRNWGVIYISVGDITAVTVRVQDADGTPRPGLEVKLVEAAGNKLITNEAGEVLFDTKVVGPATLEVRLLPGTETDPIATQIIDIVETVPMTVVVVL